MSTPARKPPTEHDPRSAIDALARRASHVLEQHPCVRWGYAFGSAARGEHFRDLDIGVVLSDASAMAFGSLIAALEAALPEVKVDVVDLAAAAPALRGHAVRDGLLLLDRERNARVDWEVDATRRWLDLKPWLARGEALRHEALKERSR